MRMRHTGVSGSTISLHGISCTRGLRHSRCPVTSKYVPSSKATHFRTLSATELPSQHARSAVTRTEFRPPTHAASTTGPLLTDYAYNYVRRRHARDTPDASTGSAWKYADMDEATLRHTLRTAADAGKLVKVREIVTHMIEERTMAPDSRTFAALIKVNVDPTYGSVHRVMKLIREMLANGISLDSGTCHAALAVLSVHPDANLRSDILHFMDYLSIGVSREGLHHIVAGYIREGNIEAALRSLHDMRQAGHDVEGWLSDLVILVLVSLKEVVAAQAEMVSRTAGGNDTIDSQIWHAFLDAATVKQNLQAVKYAWKTHVQTRLISPSIGSCRQALRTASSHGDAALASSILNHLVQAGAIIGIADYSLLVDAYLKADDLEAALTTVSVAYDDDVYFTRTWTRSFFGHLKDNAAWLHKTESILTKLHERGHKIPLAVLNTVLEAYGAKGDFGAVLQIYRTMHKFEEAGAEGEPRLPFADSHTFETLYRVVRDSKDDVLEALSFIRTEQRILGIPWTPLMLDRCLIVYLLEAQVDLAAELLDTIQKQGIHLRHGTAETMIKLIESGQAQSLKQYEGIAVRSLPKRRRPVLQDFLTRS